VNDIDLKKYFGRNDGKRSDGQCLGSMGGVYYGILHAAIHFAAINRAVLGPSLNVDCDAERRKINKY